MQGDIALVGAQFGGISNEGSVHVFTRAGDLWTLQGKLAPSSLSDSNWFGVGIVMRDATALVGASGRGLTGPAYRGSVHVFSLPSADGPPERAYHDWISGAFDDRSAKGTPTPSAKSQSVCQATGAT